MLSNDIRRLPAVRGKTPVGNITRHDLLRLMLASIFSCLGPVIAALEFPISCYLFLGVWPAARF
jgi:CBS domain-containing protein